MKPYNGRRPNNSGTNVAQGLPWGWRVLSPDRAVRRGRQNTLTRRREGARALSATAATRWCPTATTHGSDYNSYDYLAAGRLGTHQRLPTRPSALSTTRSRAICETMKGTGIRVYTILFQVDFEETQDLFRNCASKNDKGEPLYYYVPDDLTARDGLRRNRRGPDEPPHRPLDCQLHAPLRETSGRAFRPALLFIPAQRACGEGLLGRAHFVLCFGKVR